MARITEISEFQDRGRKPYGIESGFEIRLSDEQVITLAIDAYQDCCEDWGYFLTEDDTAKFVGAEVLDVYITDSGLTSRAVEAGKELDEGDVMFVNIATDRGKLQFVAYNAHNGYYSHTARVEYRALTKEVVL